MARKKIESKENGSVNFSNSSEFEPADILQAEVLKTAFESIITSQFGFARAPEPYVTPFGIKHFDALLGGGIVSSSPVVLSSTPETGKSTLGFQFSSIFQMLYPNALIVYIDIEAAANRSRTNNESGGMSRIDAFNLDRKRFQYEPLIVDIVQLFALIESLTQIKKMAEQKTQKEFKVMIIWDSIAATPSSKTEEAEDVNKIIGVF